VPAITTLDPAIAAAGGASFTLTVNGSNFISVSVVKLNGGDRPTTFITGSQLTAADSASDIQTAGTPNISVFNPLPAGGNSGTASLTINNPIPALSSLAPATAVVAGPASL